MLQKDLLERCLLKEVEVIQDAIRRMASNSFLIKGWTITIVVACIALTLEGWQVLVAAVPIVLFWYLDAHFLLQEHMFRKLYSWVIANRLQTDEHLLEMNPTRFRREVGSIYPRLFSKTLLWFYGILLAMTVVCCILAVTVRVHNTNGGC